jgi:hypothetical protein
VAKNNAAAASAPSDSDWSRARQAAGSAFQRARPSIKPNTREDENEDEAEEEDETAAAAESKSGLKSGLKSGSAASASPRLRIDYNWNPAKDGPLLTPDSEAVVRIRGM